jgi:hypothetical protein
VIRLLPLGFAAGARFAPDDAIDEGHGFVALGGELVEVSVPLYDTWLAVRAFAEADAAADPHLLVSWAGERDIDLDPVLLELEQRGLLIPAAPDGLVDQLGELRLLPTGFALGNTPDEVGVFAIAGPDGIPRALVDRLVFEAWLAGAAGSSLGALAIRNPLGGNGRPAQAVARLLESLPALIASGIAWLDRVPAATTSSASAGTG